jgi:hypothetical protein
MQVADEAQAATKSLSPPMASGFRAGLADKKETGGDEARAALAGGEPVAAEDDAIALAKGGKTAAAPIMTEEDKRASPAVATARPEPRHVLCRGCARLMSSLSVSPPKASRLAMPEAEARRTDAALEALIRLSAEAAATADRLERRLDAVAGKPDIPQRKSKLQLARNAAACPVSASASPRPSARPPPSRGVARAGGSSTAADGGGNRPWQSR